MFFFLFFLGVVFVFLFYLLNVILSSKQQCFLGNSSFESGFDGAGKVQVSFSVHFFLIMLLFIIFDVEIVMLLGLLLGASFSIFSFFFIFFFLLFGLYLEWYFNKLSWSL